VHARDEIQEHNADNFTFLTVSTVNTSQPEYAGVGFVLSPMAPNALVRTSFINSRIACISLLIQGGELKHRIHTYVPQNARPEDERRDHIEKLQQAISQIARKGPFVVLGDFNSRLQGRLHGEEDVLGPRMFGMDSCGGRDR